MQCGASKEGFLIRQGKQVVCNKSHTGKAKSALPNSAFQGEVQNPIFDKAHPHENPTH